MKLLKTESKIIFSSRALALKRGNPGSYHLVLLNFLCWVNYEIIQRIVFKGNLELQSMQSFITYPYSF